MDCVSAGRFGFILRRLSSGLVLRVVVAVSRVTMTHCLFCGAFLMGGMTEHRPGCQILKILAEAKKSVPAPLPPDTSAANAQRTRPDESEGSGR
jgi:hypothetical protein